DCPVTTFVATGFLDKRLWFWWDQIEYAFSRAQRPAVRVELGGSPVNYDLRSESARRLAQEDFTKRCKGLPDRAKEEGIRALAQDLDVALPSSAPPQYAPMSWDALRWAEGKGMRFGPHTVTHPILSRVGDDRVRTELQESWARLREEVRNPVPVYS